MASFVPPQVASLIGFIVAVVIIYYGVKKFGWGIDNKPSIANIQLILWTGIMLGSYSALALAKGGIMENIPENTLVLIGIASGTTPFAAIIRHGQEPNPPAPQPRSTGNNERIGLFASEKVDTKTSIAKMQMFAWNILAMVLFILLVGQNISNAMYEFPDLGTLLTSLIAIGNGVYLANKTADPPKTKPAA